MENQHKQIKGYRDLSQAEIDMMNDIKSFESQFNRLIDRMRSASDFDQRLVSLGATEAEKAFFFLVKAVARPERL